MKDDILYTERQRNKPVWFWVIMLLLNAVFVIGIIWQILLGNKFGNNPMSNTGLIIVTFFVLLLTFCMWRSDLVTYVSAEGVYYRYFPFHLKFKFIPFEDVVSVSLRAYRPLKELGGYGIHVGRKRKVYNMSGHWCLELKLKNGKKILIGTQNPDELDDVLIKLKKKNQALS